MGMMKCQGFNPGDRVIRNKTRDRGLFFVISGQFFGLDDTFPQTRHVFKTGAIIGMDQFLDSERWDMDIIC